MRTRSVREQAERASQYESLIYNFRSLKSLIDDDNNFFITCVSVCCVSVRGNEYTLADFICVISKQMRNSPISF